MVKVVQDLWILNSGGIVLYSRVFDEKVNEQLFGALMVALSSFAKKLSEGGLTSFDLSSIRFTILKANLNDVEYLFVANSAKKFKEKKIQEELKRISERFFNRYSDILEDWDSDLNVFSDFEHEIESSLEDPIKKFWEGLV